jgi:hypothetical protein
MTKSLKIIKNLKIHIHGIPYITTFIVLKNNVVNSSYFMLLGRPWLKDAKITHDWCNNVICRNPTLGLSVRMHLTLPKVGKWSPPWLPKTQKTIWGVKSPCLYAFFISMERSWSVDAQNGLAWAIWTFVAQVMGKRGARSQTVSLTLDH